MSGADLLSVYKLIVLVQLARGDTRYMPRASIARTLMCILFCATAVVAQQISGSIIGVVKDSQMASIVGAKVTLSDQAQGTSREATTATDGSFVFTLVQPGSYNVTVESPGFKKFEQKDIKVFANDRVTLGDITLSVGALSDTITVEAHVAAVQTATAERSGVLTSRQAVELSESGRSLFDLVPTLPGIFYSGTGSNLGGIAANGNRSNQNNF